MARTKKPTKAQMNALRAVVAAAYPLDDHSDLVVVMDWDWSGEPRPALIWEGGPYDWAIECQQVRDAAMARGLWVEPQTSFALNVYVD